ncbi:MAG: hypothetical protein ACI828_000125 [Flavobacteriales bacterium]|jgi:hypothetical protein
MKKVLLIAIILLNVSCLYKQLDCKIIKVGTFKIDDPTYDFKSIIIRNDTIQIEKNLTLNTVSKYVVKWKNPCEYSLEMIEGPNDKMELNKGKILRIKIISIQEDNYTFEAKMDGIAIVATNTAERIK